MKNTANCSAIVFSSKWVIEKRHISIFARLLNMLTMSLEIEYLFYFLEKMVTYYLNIELVTRLNRYMLTYMYEECMYVCFMLYDIDMFMVYFPDYSPPPSLIF